MAVWPFLIGNRLKINQQLYQQLWANFLPHAEESMIVSRDLVSVFGHFYKVPAMSLLKKEALGIVELLGVASSDVSTRSEILPRTDPDCHFPPVHV